MKHQSEHLGTEPIPKLLLKLSVPAMLGALVMALYNVVDTIFVSIAVGTIGVAAVSIAFPVQMIIMALAGAIGIGGASLISRLLGAGEKDKANQVFGNVISLVILVSFVGLLIGLRYLTPLLYLFGSSDSILPYAQDYLGVILFGTVFFAFAFSMNNIIRSEGNAKVAMYSMLVSSILNIILTPLFIFTFGLGVKGSAIATVLSQGITAIYLVLYFLRGKSSLTFHAKNLLPFWHHIQKIAAIGSAAFIQMGASSVMYVVANHLLGTYGGDVAIGVFGIIHKVLMFAMMPIMGVVQGLTPLVGYNFGAKLHDRVTESIKLAIKATTGIAAIGFLAIMIFPKLIMLIFTDELPAIEMGVSALRIMFALSLTIGIQMVAGSVFQALGRARAAAILSLSRQVLFLIPFLLIMPYFFKLTGIWIAFPMADIFAFSLSLWFMNRNKEIFSAAPATVANEPCLE
ncbi:MATE family efflux transporter [Desulfuribacillus stibiiarsenatis]|uniref:Multidrug export protein MepA n=1 Tax=Desulfuribacillus stibiiarsenatis TaxID=1390249 RepID=A0A1E5L8D8_9FIRM|nr:MATE family efflux transporter [Desulfuribacillus stibiiarsenatis]OEH86422.1 MATE family efflux transporter [Desulfuribacillus stibiiarsenatis]